MKFSKDETAYLNGKKFANGKFFTVAAPNNKNTDRLDFLEDISKEKRIIHVGFADHIPLIDSKISNGTWLHKRLIDVSNKCVGIDILQDSVTYVREKHKISNLFCLDIIKDEPPASIANEVWDYMIIGEVIEHIDNPVEFLDIIRQKYKPFVKNIIITVPNAFRWHNIRLIFKHQEFINTDHRFWFTPFTLAKIITQAGYDMDYYLLSQTIVDFSFLKKTLIKRYPLCRETIIAVASF